MGSTDILGELRDSISAARYNASSVLASLAVSLGASVVLFVTFLILRRRIQTLYASKPHKSVKNWPYPGNALFSWVSPVYRMRLAEDLQPRLGLDVVVYLRYLRMLRNMFLCLGVIGCCVGIPINVYYNWRSPYRANNLSKQDAFVLMTPTLVTGNAMIAHVAMGWACTIVVILHLYFAYKWILNMRKSYYADYNHRRKITNRTVMAVDVDKAHRSDDGLMRIAHNCNSQCRPVNATVGRDVKHLEVLMAEHKHAVVSLERALLNKVPKRGDYLGASTDDKVVHWTKVTEELAARIGQERSMCRKENRLLSYGFISYASQNQAHEIAQMTRKKTVNGSSIRLAPSPPDIIWSNVALGIHQRRSKRLWINIIYTGLLVLWIVPAALLGCFFTNFKRIGMLWPAFARAMEAHTVGFAILQGVVAPFIMMLIFMMLPPLLRKLCKWEGLLTRTDREKEVIRKLFVLFFLINFFVFTCMGVIWDVVAEVISIVRSGQGESFEQVWEELRLSQRFATAVIDISSFWVMYLLRSISELFASLAQVLSLISRAYQRLFTKFTPRDRANWTEPQAFPYAQAYIWTAFYAAIGLGLTTIQPLVLAINAVYFSIALPFKKYELMYMYYTKYESNGLFWPMVHNIVIVSSIFGNLVLLCVVWVQGNRNIAMGVFPLPVVMIIYKVFSYFVFDKNYWYFVDASDDEKMHLDNEDDLDELYENPLLSMPLEKVIIERPDGVKERIPVLPPLGKQDPMEVDQNTIAAPEPFDDIQDEKEYGPSYDPPYDPPSGISDLYRESYATSSPSSCPYPEQAMFSNSTVSLVNTNLYDDDQNLLESAERERDANNYNRYRYGPTGSSNNMPYYHGRFDQ